MSVGHHVIRALSSKGYPSIYDLTYGSIFLYILDLVYFVVSYFNAEWKKIRYYENLFNDEKRPFCLLCIDKIVCHNRELHAVSRLGRRKKCSFRPCHVWPPPACTPSCYKTSTTSLFWLNFWQKTPSLGFFLDSFCSRVSSLREWIHKPIRVWAS